MNATTTFERSRTQGLRQQIGTPHVGSVNARPAPDLTVSFEPRDDKLIATDAAKLATWASGLIDSQPEVMVMMACNAPSDRSKRVKRLRALRGLLVQSGIPENSIRYTGDRIGMLPSGPTRQDEKDMAVETQAAGSVALRVVSMQRTEGPVRSIRSYFPAVTTSKEAVSSNAS